MKSPIRIFLAILALIPTQALSSPGVGGGGGINAVATNQALNNQSAIGTVNQSPVGGINSNYQINNSQATDYGFAPGIYCRGANFSIGGYGSGAFSSAYSLSSSASDYGVIVLFTLPFPNEVNNQCRELAKEIVKQRQLDTKFNLIKVCSSLVKEQITLDYSKFPEFEICEGVKTASSSSLEPVRNNPFRPKEDASVVVPVR